MVKRHLLLITAVISLVWANSLFGGFVYDDHALIVNNSFIKDSKNLPLYFSRKYISSSASSLHYQGSAELNSGETTYRPVATFSYFLTYSLFGLDPFWFRVVNVLIHLSNALLIYGLMNMLFLDPRLALFVSLVFGVHPVSAEVVNCTGSRPNSLSLLFCLAAIVLYFRYRDQPGIRKRAYLAVSLACAFLAAFSKEIAVVLPLALALCEYYRVGYDLKRLVSSWRAYLLYLAVVLFYCWVYFVVMPPQQRIFDTQGIGNNIFRTLDVLVIYLKELFFPWNTVFIPPMAIFRSYPRVVLGAAVILACLYILVKRDKFPPEFSFAICWFFLWLLPMNNFLNSFRIPAAYRFIYIPLIGFALIAGSFLLKAWEGRIKLFLAVPVLRRALPVAFIAYLSLGTFFANICWSNEMVFGLSVVEKYPRSFCAHIDMGEIWMGRGNYPEARKEFESALAKRPSHTEYPIYTVKAYISLTNIYLHNGEYAKAEEELLEAIMLFPEMPYLFTALGVCYGRQGQFERAFEQFRKAKELNPSYAYAYTESGKAHIFLREKEAARREFAEALRLDPNSSEARNGLERIDKEQLKE